MSEHFSPHKNKINEPLDNANTSKKIRTYENKWFDHNSSNTSLDRNLNDTASTSRYGRTRKPKISEDYYNIEDIFAPYEKIINRKKPQLDLKSTTNSVTLSSEDEIMNIFSNDLPEENLEVSKVLKIVSNKPTTDFSERSPSSSAKPLKTYVNRNRVPSTKIVESFALPDYDNVLNPPSNYVEIYPKKDLTNCTPTKNPLKSITSSNMSNNASIKLSENIKNPSDTSKKHDKSTDIAEKPDTTDNISNPSESSNSDIDPSELTLNELSIYMKDPSKFRRKRREEDENEPLDKIKKRIQKKDTSDLNTKLNKNKVTENKNKTTVKVTASKLKIIGRQQKRTHGVVKKPTFKKNKIFLNEIIKDLNTYSDVDESGSKFHIDMNYKPDIGSLAWARVGSYPFWPAIVSKEPGKDYFTKDKIFGMKPKCFYHVNFFGDNGRRSWVLATHVFPFRSMKDMEEMAKFVSDKVKPKDPQHISAFIIHPGRVQKWERAVTEAQSLLKYPIERRVKRFFDLLKKAANKPKTISESSSKHVSETETAPTKSKKDSLDEGSPEKSPRKSTDLDTQPLKIAMKFRKISTDSDATTKSASKSSKSSVEAELQQPPVRKGPEKLEEKDAIEAPKKLNTSSEVIETRLKNAAKRKFRSGSPKIVDEKQEKAGDFVIDQLEIEEKLPKVDVPENNSPVSIQSQTSKSKKFSLFRGVTKERVCQICGLPKKVVKCSGNCFGLFHVECDRLLFEKVQKQTKESPESDQFQSKQQTEKAIPKKMTAKTKPQRKFLKKQEQKLLMDSQLKNSPREDTPDEKTTLDENGGKNEVGIAAKPPELNQETIKPEGDNVKNDEKPLDEIENEVFENDKNMEVDELNLKVLHEIAVKIKSDVRDEIRGNSNELKKEELKKNLQESGMKNLSITDGMDAILSEVMKDSMLAKYDYDSEEFSDTGSMFEPETAETTTEDTLKKTEIAPASNMRIIKHVTADGVYDIVQNVAPVETEKKINESFKCTYCRLDMIPPCFVCGKINKFGDSILHRCQTFHCGKYYHESCLSAWPQAKWHLVTRGKQTYNENLCCPYHNCHTCISDDPRAPLARSASEKLAKCIKCPTTYHRSSYCIPAGTEILSSHQIICPKHWAGDKLENGKKIVQHINTSWCFICSIGGSLICCETCPSSFHVECLKLVPPEGRYFCEECESGRLPLYGEIIWAKLGAYRWWPGRILFPYEIPENVKSKKHRQGEFVVRFFGTHDHYWVNRGRVFIFQEGDNGNVSTTKKNTFNGVFIKAVQEAKMAHKNFLEERENRTTDQDVGLKPPPYIKIKSNRPVGDVRYNDGDTSNTTACECDPNSEAPCGPDSDCLNRILLTECNPAVCRASTRCCNQAFEKREYARVQPFRTGGSNGGSGGRGWGLRTLQPIARGSFVIEYVGEIINEPEYRRRLHRKHQQKDENYYFLTIDKDRMIDAGPKGNEARFMNHSCTPNCVTQKWTVNGDTRVGLFAIEDIPTGAELTFNYNLECIGEEKKVCRCGSANCSGFIGLKVKQEENGKRKKSLSKPKKKKSVDGKPEELTDICLKCKKVGATQYCDRDECNRCFHLECVNLTEEPTGKWICPVHFCNVCSKRSSNFCKLCPNSFCKLHSTQKITHMWLKAYLCEDHTESEIEELKEKLTKSKSSFNARDLRVQQRNKIRIKWENDSFKLSPKRKLHKTRAGKKKLKVSSLMKLKPKLKQRSPIKKSKKDKKVSKLSKSWSNSTDDDENTKPLAKLARQSKKIEKNIEKDVQKIEADKNKKMGDENVNSEKETVENNKEGATKNIEEAKIESNSNDCQATPIKTSLDSQNLSDTKADINENQKDDKEIVRETNKTVQEPTNITVTSKLDEKPKLVRSQNLEKTSNKYGQKGGKKMLGQKVSVNILKTDKNLAEKYLKTKKPSPKKNVVKSRIARDDTGKKTSGIDEIKGTENLEKTTESSISNLSRNSSSSENSPVKQTSSRITENIGVNLKIANPKLAEKIVKTLTKKLDVPATEKEIKNRPGTIQEKILSCTKRNDIINDIKNDDFCNLISSTPKRILDDKLNIQTSDAVEKSSTSFNSSLGKATCQNTNLNDPQQTSTKEPESSSDSRSKIRSVSTSFTQTKVLSSKRKVHEIESSSDDDSSKPLIMLTKRQKIQTASPKLSKFSKLTLKKLTSPESPTKAYKTVERPSSARPTRSNTKAPDIKMDELKLRMRKRKTIENMLQEKKLTDSESELSDSKSELDSIFNKKHPLKTWIDSAKIDELEDTLTEQETQFEVEDNTESKEKEEIMEENKNVQQNINPSTKITGTDNFDASSTKNVSPPKLQDSTIKTNATLPQKTDDSQNLSTNKKQIALKNATVDKNINISEEPTKAVSSSKISKGITPLPPKNTDREQKTTNLKETSKILQEKKITVEKELVSDENNKKLDEKTTDLERNGKDFVEKCLDLQAKCMGLETKQPVVEKHIDSSEKLVEEKRVECLEEKPPNLEEKVLVAKEKHLGLEEQNLSLEEQHLSLEEQHLSLQKRHLNLEEKHLGLDKKHLGLKKKRRDLEEKRADSNKNGPGLEENPKSLERQQKGLENIQKGLEEKQKALEGEQKALEGEKKALEEQKDLEEEQKALEEEQKALEGEQKALEEQKGLEEKQKGLEEEQKRLKEKHEGLEEKYKDFEETTTKCEEKHTDLDMKPLYGKEKLKYLLEKTKILDENTTKLEEKSTDLGEHCKDLLEKPKDLKEPAKNLKEKSTKLADKPTCLKEKSIEPEEKPIKLENTCSNERRKHSEICTQETNTPSIKISEKLKENITDLKKPTKNLNENVTELQVKQNIKNVEEKNTSEEKSTNLTEKTVALQDKKIDLEEPNKNLNKKCKYKNVNLEEKGMGLKENYAVSKENKQDVKDITSNKEKIVCLKNTSADFVKPITTLKAQDKSLDEDEVNIGNDVKIKQNSSELKQSDTSLLEKSKIVKEKITTLVEKSTNLEEKSTNLEEKPTNLKEKSTNLRKKGTHLEETPTNLEEKSTNLEEKSTNLEEKSTNLEEKSTNLKEKSTNLRKKGTNLEENPTNFEEQSTNLVEKSTNLEEKSTNLREKFTNLEENPKNSEEKSTNLKEKSTNLKEKPKNFKDKSSNFKEKPKSLEEKSTNLKEKSKNLKGKPKNLEEKSTNLQEKSSNLEETSTNLKEKPKYLEEKSTNLEDKSTNLEEKPKSLEEKSTNLEEKSTNKNLKDKSKNLDEESSIFDEKPIKLETNTENSEEKPIDINSIDIEDEFAHLADISSDDKEKPINLEEKSTSPESKSISLEERSTNLTDKTTNVKDKYTNLDGKSAHLGGRSLSLKRKQTNLENKTTNLAEKSTSIAEKSTNSAGKSTNSAEKSTNLAEKSTNLAGKSTNMAGKSTNLAGKSTNSAGKSTNSEEKSTNLAEKSRNPAEKSTNSAGKSTNSAGKSSISAEKSTNLAEKSTNLAGKSTNMAEKSTNLTGKSTNSAEKSTNSADKSSISEEKSTNSAEKSTNSAEKSTNLTGKCTNSAEKSTNLAEKSTNLARKTTNSAGKSTNSAEKSTNSAEKSTNLTGKSTNSAEESINLTEKSTILVDKSTNFTGKSTNLSEKSTNLAGKSTNLVEKSTNSAEKYTNLAGKSTHSARKSTNSEEKSTNLTEKSTNLVEESTNMTGKSTSLVEKSINLVGKSTNSAERPTNLVEKSANFKEKPKNLKEKCTNLREKPANLEEKPVNLEEKCTNMEEKSRNMYAKSTNCEEKSTNIKAKSTNVDESSINSDIKSTNLKEKSKKSANLETKSRSLDENPKNLRSKLKSLEEKSMDLETKSANSRKKGVNSQEKIKVKSDEKGTKLKEESGNLEDRPTHLKDKSNLDEKTSNLEVESMNLEGKSTNLKNKSTNLEDNSTNFKDKPTNLKDKSTNLKDKSTNLKDKPINLKDKPTNLKDKTTNLEDVSTNLEQNPGNLKDISKNLESTSTSLEDLSTNLQDKSTNLEDKLKNLEDSSMNVDKKCTDSQEKTTNSNKKFTSLPEKSTNLGEKPTSLEENPTTLEEKSRNFEEKRKNLKEKRTLGRILDISSSDTTDLNPKLESSSPQNVHSLSMKSLEETKTTNNETISESSSLDSANKTQSDVKNGMSAIEKDIQPDAEISVSETKNLFDKIDAKELKNQVQSRATTVRKSGRISSPEVSKISKLPEANSPKTTPRSEKKHKIQLGIRKSQRNLQRHPNDIFTNSSELSSPTTPKQIKLSETTPLSSKTAEKTPKSTEENQTLKSLKSPINVVSTSSPKSSVISTETQESTPSKKRKRSHSEDSDSSNRVFKKVSRTEDAKLTLKSSPKVAISRLDTSKLSSSQISVLKKQETSKNVDSGRETPRSFNTRQEITRNVVTRQETPKSVNVRQETPKTVNTKQETTGKSVNIRQETTAKNINTRQETVSSKSSNSRQETPKARNSLQGTPTAKSGNSRQETTPKGTSSRQETTPKGASSRQETTPKGTSSRQETTPKGVNSRQETTPKGVISRQETTPKTGNSRQETTPKLVNTRQGTPTPKGVHVRQEISRVVLSRHEATPKPVIFLQEASTPKTTRQDTPTRSGSSRQVSTKSLTSQQDTTKIVETPKSSSSRTDSSKSSPSGSSTSIAKTETPKTPQVLRSDGSRKWLLRYDSVPCTTPKLDSLKSSTSKPDISKPSPSRIDSSKLSLSKHDTTKQSNPRIEPSKNLNVKDNSKVVCVRLNNKDATKSVPSSDIPSTSVAQNERKRTRETRSTSSKAPEIINDRYKEILQRDSIVTVPEVKLSSTIPARHLRVILNKNIGIDTKNDNRFIEMQNELEKDLPIRKRSKLRLEL